MTAYGDRVRETVVACTDNLSILRALSADKPHNARAILRDYRYVLEALRDEDEGRPAPVLRVTDPRLSVQQTD